MPYYEYEFNHQEVLRITSERIKRAMYTPVTQISAEAWVTSEPVCFGQRTDGTHIFLSPGDRWGNLWDCAWIHIQGTIPPEAAGKKVVLKIDVCGEGLVCDGHGIPIKGITTVRSRCVPELGNFGKSIVPVCECAQGNEPVEFWIDAGCNDLFGAYQGGIFLEACLAVCHSEVRALYYDFAVLYELMQAADPKKALYHKLLKGLTDTAKLLREYTDEEARGARQILAPLLTLKGEENGFVLSLVGHAHLDLAWTWPIRETIRKGARTFSTALHHMKTYPDYVFSASQAQLYEWMRLYYPTVFQKIQERVVSGNWEITGGMWVEPDLNVTSGESLVRQFLYGQRFFQKYFGKEIKVGWIPDSFGFTGALPQIMKKAGLEYFLTQKPRTAPNIISYPHDVFWWEGIDGTRILTHFAPGTTYSSSAAPMDLALTEERFKDKMVAPACIVLFGQGDGGGGAGAECMESIQRIGNIAGLSPVVNEPSQKLFERLEKSAGSYKTWRGPMDLDMHTGTFTTSHRSKTCNRRMENLLKEAEYYCAMASQTTGFSYPAEEFEAIWREMLLYQFHDILPGTSIRRVYDESWERYETLLAQLNDISQRAREAMYPSGIYLQNMLSWERSQVMELEGKAVKVTVPPMGLYPLKGCKQEFADEQALSAGSNRMENDLLEIEFGNDGCLTQIWDKKREKNLLEHPSNQLVVFDDRLDYNESWGIENAWDIPIRYADGQMQRPKLLEQCCLLKETMAVCRQRYQYGNSVIEQEIRLVSGSDQIEFDTTVDWKEHEKLLRTRFYPSLHPKLVTRGTQFGYVQESNDKNIPWNFARFEVCGQRFLDLSLENEGMALLSPIKCGYRIQDGILDLALLRSSSSPGESIDIGVHHFAYALYPHRDDAVKARVMEHALELDNAVSVVTVKQGNGTAVPDVGIGAAGAIVECFKKSEDESGWILRLYEHNGIFADAVIQLPFVPGSVRETDLLERPFRQITCDRRTLNLKLKPFEIVTLLLQK